jgi:hypothetical protein
MIGPVVAAYVFDTTGSYRLFIQGDIPLFLVCALLMTLLPPTPRTAAEPEEALLPILE